MAPVPPALVDPDRSGRSCTVEQLGEGRCRGARHIGRRRHPTSGRDLSASPSTHEDEERVASPGCALSTQVASPSTHQPLTPATAPPGDSRRHRWPTGLMSGPLGPAVGWLLSACVCCPSRPDWALPWGLPGRGDQPHQAPRGVDALARRQARAGVPRRRTGGQPSARRLLADCGPGQGPPASRSPLPGQKATWWAQRR